MTINGPFYYKQSLRRRRPEQCSHQLSSLEFEKSIQLDGRLRALWLSSTTSQLIKMVLNHFSFLDCAAWKTGWNAWNTYAYTARIHTHLRSIGCATIVWRETCSMKLLKLIQYKHKSLQHGTQKTPSATGSHLLSAYQQVSIRILIRFAGFDMTNISDFLHLAPKHRFRSRPECYMQCYVWLFSRFHSMCFLYYCICVQLWISDKLN